MVEAANELVGGRFDVRGRLGEGGMGVVFRAFDAGRQREVALKTVQVASAEALVRFKGEFRALAGVSHPNLVTMYELVSDEDRFYVAMELVSGPSFLAFVRSDDDVDADFDAVTHTTVDATQGAPIVAHASSARGVRFHRLAHAALQAADGIAYLHGRGILHRDIKPSNILIRESSGRVMLCDFGLAQAASAVQHGRLEGTVAYLAPEIACGMPASEASDWYAFGCTLYQCILGRLPFVGTPSEILTARAQGDAIPASVLDPVVPEVWSQLCADLLRPRPADRPCGPEVLDRLRALYEDEAERIANSEHPPDPAVFASSVRGRLTNAISTELSLTGSAAVLCLGREAERAAVVSFLRGEGRSHVGPSAVYLKGLSGLGKSTLAEAAIFDLGGDERLVLRGRCNEAEHLPFKALDGIVDALSEELVDLTLPELERFATDPNVPALLRLFPVLRRVPELRKAGALEGRVPLAQLRRRAFSGLRSLLAKVHAFRPTLLVVDDLQWIDRDSVELMRALFEADDAPPLSLIGTFRSDEVASSPPLRQLLSSNGALGANAFHQSVDPLPPEGARELAAALLSETPMLPVVDKIVQAARGNPLVIHELVTHALADDSTSLSSRDINLDNMLAVRVSRLSPAEREVLQVVCVSGRATPEGTLAAACTAPDLPGTLASLRAASLLKWRVLNRTDNYEPFHDRVREVVVGGLLPKERRGLHQQLAQVIQALPQPDYDALVTHCLGAGAYDLVGRFAARAAEHSRGAMAFDRAAYLYGVAVEHATAAEDMEALKVAWAQSLALAGQTLQAANLYLELSQDRPSRAQEFESLAARYLMDVGETERGGVVLAQVARRAGVPIPRSEGSALLIWLWRLFRIRFLAGKKPLMQATAEQLNRLDVGWLAAQCLAMSNTAASQAVSSLGLLWAYRGSDPQRLARASVGEVLRHAIGTKKAREKATRLLTDVYAIEGVEREKLAIGAYAEVLIAYQAGHFHECVLASEAALDQVRTHTPDDQWVVVSIQLAQLWALFHAGDVRAYRLRNREYREESERSGSRYGMALFRIGLSGAVDLLDDEPEQMLENGRQALRLWPKGGFQLEHHFQMMGEVFALLMLDRAEEAHAYVRKRWWAFMTSGLGAVMPLVHLEGLATRARAAMALTGDPRTLKEVRKLARRMMKFPEPWYQCFGLQFEALADMRQGLPTAVTHLGEAAEAFDLHQMPLFAEVTRLRMGEAMADAKGRELYERSVQAMRERGVANPARLAKALAPSGRSTGDESPFPVNEGC